MYKKVILFLIFLTTSIGIIYPTKEENTKLFDYCHSFEKIISRNLIRKKKNLSREAEFISKNITKIGIRKSQGALIKKIIDQYKNSNNSLIISFLSSDFYCFGGYWIETVKPGKFESLLYENSKKKINDFNNLKDEIDGFLNNLNSEYQIFIK